ncbi:MAG: ferritin-like domain-containing protein [Gammaproteobacteria bacterium]|nr:ferritin-like domain-containing protein [Gammaproteobacteria bacterium]
MDTNLRCDQAADDSCIIKKNEFTFNQKFTGSLLWNYHTTPSPESLTCARLTRLASSKHWNPFIDINWSHEGRDAQSPFKGNADPFSGFDEYERLPDKTRVDISWQLLGMQLSEILHGEQLALMCAAQLMSLMPCMESRLFASTQAADEARHIEFFRRYLTTTGLHIHPPSACLNNLMKQVLQTSRWEIKLLVCQILIESLALAQFRHLIATHSQALLREGLLRIVEDEARHVKFGADYLKALFVRYSPDELERYGHYVVDRAFELASSDNHGLVIARDQQWDMGKLRLHLRQQRIREPALLQQRFRQLSINIKNIGLMTNSVKTRLLRFDDC